MDFPKGTNAIFIGRECEGPMKGHRTLYIVGNPPYTEIVAALLVHKKYTHVYFGAGRSCWYHKQTVLALAKYLDTHREPYSLVRTITIENPLFDLRFYNQVHHYVQCFWMLPFVEQLTMSTIKKLARSHSRIDYSSIYVRVERGGANFVVNLEDLTFAEASNYAKDKLLYQG